MSTTLVIFAPLSVTALSVSITLFQIAFETVILIKDVSGFIVGRIWYGENNICDTCRRRVEEKEFLLVENKHKYIRTQIILDDILPSPDNTPVHL